MPCVCFFWVVIDRASRLTDGKTSVVGVRSINCIVFVHVLCTRVHVYLPCPPFVRPHPPSGRLFAHLLLPGERVRPLLARHRRYSLSRRISSRSTEPRSPRARSCGARTPAPGKPPRLILDLSARRNTAALFCGSCFFFFCLAPSREKTPGVHLPRLDQGGGLARRARRRPSPEHQGVPGNGGAFRSHCAPGVLMDGARSFFRAPPPPPPSRKHEYGAPSWVFARAATAPVRGRHGVLRLESVRSCRVRLSDGGGVASWSRGDGGQGGRAYRVRAARRKRTGGLSGLFSWCPSPPGVAANEDGLCRSMCLLL